MPLGVGSVVMSPPQLGQVPITAGVWPVARARMRHVSLMVSARASQSAAWACAHVKVPIRYGSVDRGAGAGLLR